MYGEPEIWHELASRLAEIARTYLQVQVAAGASAVQLFDSWAGALSEADYREYVLPHSARVLDGRSGGAAYPLRRRHRRAARGHGRGGR